MAGSCGGAGDVEEGFLLAGEGRIRQILGGGRRAHGHGPVAAAVVGAQLGVGRADVLGQLRLQRGIDHPGADFLARGGQRVDVLDVQRGQLVQRLGGAQAVDEAHPFLRAPVGDDLAARHGAGAGEGDARGIDAAEVARLRLGCERRDARFGQPGLQFGLGRRGRRFARLQRGDLAARLEAELAFTDHALATLQAFGDLHLAVAHFHAAAHGLHLYRVVALHDVDVLAIRATQHRLGRDDHAATDGTQLHAHVDELARPQPVVGVVEDRAGLERAAVGADQVVDHVQLAVAGKHVRIGAVQRGHRHRPGRLRLAHVAELALGQVERHVDRMDLGQRDQRGTRVDHVAGVDRADAGNAGDRCGDLGVLQLHLSVLATYWRYSGAFERWKLERAVASRASFWRLAAAAWS
ncbi:hypothetical protein G6F31_013503 [Rhizopus arrhizus]|nr:hypothetical protein G6F31_013503 [Rhizopus arrhizus]